METYTRIKDILLLDTSTEETHRICGWVNQVRKQQELCFILINDGSCISGIQIVVSKQDSIFDELRQLNNGCFIVVDGVLVESGGSGQKYDFKPHTLIECNECDTIKYPIKKRNTIENLRQISHLRTRTKLFGAIMRMRNTVMNATHRFFNDHKYLHLDPNILTMNECEGGAGVFQATEWCPKTMKDIPSRNGIIDWKKDHFKEPVYLTVSSQLQLEAMACSLGNVYTTNRSFRAEHSTTNKHMSEFTHLEIEAIMCDNSYLMDIGERYIKHIIKMVYDAHIDELTFLTKNACKGILERYDDLLNMEYYRVKYGDCIYILKENGFEVEYGDDLSSAMENFLCEYHKGAVFVYNWPFKIKSFYMKQNSDGTCECFDLLMPYGIGELIGGSMREERLNELTQAMKDKQVPDKHLQWYLDLRRFGTVRHGGFGLGLDRLLMLVTGMKNIKDVVPIPVYYQSCKY